MKAEILDILCRNIGEFVSGEEISRSLGISRAAVNKHAGDLKARGYAIVSAKKRGYCLCSLDDCFDEIALAMFLKRRGLELPIGFFESTDSTNAIAKKLAGGQRGMVAAAAQTAGRGRMGRDFVSDEGGIYFTYYCRPDRLSPMDGLKAVFCAALAVRSALGKHAECGIKWTNDIYAEGKKVCGILCEMVSDSDRVEFLLQGIGINVNNKIEGELSEKAASLKQIAEKTFNRAELCAEVVALLEHYNGLLFSGRFGEVLKEYRQHCLTLGRKVEVTGDAGFSGIAEDIDENGFLIVKTPSGSKKVVSGDVSVIW